MEPSLKSHSEHSGKAHIDDVTLTLISPEANVSILQ